MTIAHYGRENGGWKPFVALPTKVVSYLPYNLPAEFPSKAPEVMAHYFTQFPIRLESSPVPSNAKTPGYYYEKYYKPGITGESGKHARYGGFVRDFPYQTNLSSTGTAGWEQKDMELEIRQAINAGLTGFTIDMLSIRGYDGATDTVGHWTRIKRMFDAADAVNAADKTNFKLMLMPDGTAGSTAWVKDGTVPDINASADALANAINQLANRKSIYKIDNRLVIGPFGPEKWPSDVTGVNAGDRVNFWQRFKSTMTETYAKPVHLWMCYVDSWTGSTGAPLFNSIAYGHGRWGDRDAISLAAETTNNRRAASHCHTTYKKPWMHFGGTPMDTRPVSAGTDGTTYRTWESQGSLSIRNSWEAAIDGGADFNQIPTWNDYSEHAHISPTLNNSYAILDLQSYYIARYRAGYWPEIVRDGLYLTHRIHRSNVTINSATQQEAFSVIAGSTPIKNEVEVLAFATDVGSLEILLDGSVISTQSVPGKGLWRFVTNLPTTTGVLSARMKRDNVLLPRTVVTSSHPLETSPMVDDFHYRSHSSLQQNP